MEFRTVIEVPKRVFKIDYESKILTLGSCFAENIGQKLADLKYNILLNPFGTLYNPISIAKSLNLLKDKALQTENDIFEEQEVWKNFNFHSRFSDTKKDKFLKAINQNIEIGNQFLQKANVLIITLGTAWVYSLITNNEVVSNCHKTNPNNFNRYKVNVNQIIEALEFIFLQQKGAKSDFKIILTVSPIRHLKDGLVENSLSKATLRLAVDYFCEKYPSWIFYFPAYEIMLDDLRDYRFYETDMLHPSAMAIDIIWNYFETHFLSEKDQGTRNKIVAVRRAASHRPTNSQTSVYQKFVGDNLIKIQQLQNKIKHSNWDEELAFFEQFL